MRRLHCSISEELDQLAPWNEAVKEEIQRRVDRQNKE